MSAEAGTGAGRLTPEREAEIRSGLRWQNVCELYQPGGGQCGRCYHTYETHELRDVLAELDALRSDLTAVQGRLAEVERERDGLARFNPDWDMLRETQASLREHMEARAVAEAEVTRLSAALEALQQENAELREDADPVRRLTRSTRKFTASLKDPGVTR